MKKKLLAIITILAFVGSFFLANYFNDHNLNLNAQFDKGIRWIESFFVSNPQLDNLIDNPHKTTPIAQAPKQYKHVEVGYASTCKDTSLGGVKYKKVGNVYTWIDEKGITNFSGTPPAKGEFKQLDFAGDKVFDYFTLDLNTQSLPYDFSQKLTAKLNTLFEIYGGLIDRESLKKVSVNLRVYPSQTAFNEVKVRNNMSANNNSPGFYSHGTNQAHLLLTDQESTMRTATHEATHAINRAIIGYSPKWLNEGLAEYSEYIKVNAKGSRVTPNKSWTNKNRIIEELLPLSVIFTASKTEWKSKLKSKLYATSWAFVYFMMDNKQRRVMLSKIIKNEQQNLCNVNDLKEVEAVIGIKLTALQQQFGRWSRLKLKMHGISQ